MGGRRQGEAARRRCRWPGERAHGLHRTARRQELRQGRRPRRGLRVPNGPSPSLRRGRAGATREEARGLSLTDKKRGESGADMAAHSAIEPGDRFFGEQQHMVRRILTAGAAGAVVLAATTPAFAHTYGGALGGGFAQGFLHPLGGLDHLLAMVAVGIWAAQLGGRALGFVPAAFVAAMVGGGIAGMAGFPLPMVEFG